MFGAKPERAWIGDRTYHGDGPVFQICKMLTGSEGGESDVWKRKEQRVILLWPKIPLCSPGEGTLECATSTYRAKHTATRTLRG